MTKNKPVNCHTDEKQENRLSLQQWKKERKIYMFIVIQKGERVCWPINAKHKLNV